MERPAPRGPEVTWREGDAPLAARPAEVRRRGAPAEAGPPGAAGPAPAARRSGRFGDGGAAGLMAAPGPGHEKYWARTAGEAPAPRSRRAAGPCHA